MGASVHEPMLGMYNLSVSLLVACIELTQMIYGYGQTHLHPLIYISTCGLWTNQLDFLVTMEVQIEI